MLTEDEHRALRALSALAQDAMQRNDLDIEHTRGILTCLWSLLQNTSFLTEFLHWLGNLAKLPDVEAEAKKIPFGMTGLKIFCKIVGSFKP